MLNKVRDDYNIISKHFSETRQGLPQEYRFLADYIKNGDKILDIGCGNGRFLYALEDKHAEYCGIDSSEEMIELAKQKFPEAKFFRPTQRICRLKTALLMILFQWLLCIISGLDLRADFMSEAHRVLKMTGF